MDDQTYLVTRFEASIVFALLLHCIVRQVDHSVGRILDVVLAATRSKISVCVPVAL